MSIGISSSNKPKHILFAKIKKKIIRKKIVPKDKLSVPFVISVSIMKK